MSNFELFLTRNIFIQSLITDVTIKRVSIIIVAVLFIACSVKNKNAQE
jgi:hypothetical protein